MSQTKTSKREICTKCSLSATCAKNLNDSPGWGNPNAKLVVLFDAPGSALAEKLFIWITKWLSLSGNDIWVDYLVKCELPPGKPKKATMKTAYQACWNHHVRQEVFDAKEVVVAGNWGAQFVAETTMKEMHGRKDPVTGVWVIYAFNFLLFNPGECVDAWRVLFKAAEGAGLKPKMNLDVEPFRFPSKKISAA